MSKTRLYTLEELVDLVRRAEVAREEAEAASAPATTYTIEQVARALKISKPSAYKLVRTGAIPVIRVGEHLMRVPKRALDKLLEGEMA
jgi:excisionase family DNA binding protein